MSHAWIAVTHLDDAGYAQHRRPSARRSRRPRRTTWRRQNGIGSRRGVRATIVLLGSLRLRRRRLESSPPRRAADRLRRHRLRASASRRSSTASTRMPTAAHHAVVRLLEPQSRRTSSRFLSVQTTSSSRRSSTAANRRRFHRFRAADPTGARRDRERGVFTVTVPAKFNGDVVWTLRHAGQTHKVPGRTKTGAYGLHWPMAMGSIPPLLGFTADGR